MQKKYMGLESLLQQDPQSNQFYSRLPGYLKTLMMRRKHEIHSAEQLREYAAQMLESLHK